MGDFGCWGASFCAGWRAVQCVTTVESLKLQVIEISREVIYEMLLWTLQ